jgi:uncharacterized coiled-coil protein SlyX
MDDRIERLLLVVEVQQQTIAIAQTTITEQRKQIAARGEHIGLLVQVGCNAAWRESWRSSE